MPNKIEQRGTPPYKISNGTFAEINGGEQFSTMQTYSDAMLELIDISQAGIKRTSYIMDATGKKVADLTTEPDIKLLKKIIRDLSEGKIQI